MKKTHSEMDHSSFDFETMNRERIWREIQSKYKGQDIPVHVLRGTLYQKVDRPDHKPQREFMTEIH